MENRAEHVARWLDAWDFHCNLADTAVVLGPFAEILGVSWCSLGNTWNLKGKQISIDENGDVQPFFTIWFIIQLKANHFNQSGSFRFLVVLKIDKHLPQDLKKYVSVSNMFHFNPYLQKRSYLTNSFQLGRNHRLVKMYAKMIRFVRRLSEILPSDPLCAKHPWSFGMSGQISSPPISAGWELLQMVVKSKGSVLKNDRNIQV